jgi:hypothetical protein
MDDHEELGTLFELFRDIFLDSHPVDGPVWDRRRVPRIDQGRICRRQLAVSFGVSPVSWSSFLIAVLIIGSVQLTMTGIIGEYLWRTLDEVRGVPDVYDRRNRRPVAIRLRAAELGEWCRSLPQHA